MQLNYKRLDRILNILWIAGRQESPSVPSGWRAQTLAEIRRIGPLRLPAAPVRNIDFTVSYRLAALAAGIMVLAGWLIFSGGLTPEPDLVAMMFDDPAGLTTSPWLSLF